MIFRGAVSIIYSKKEFCKNCLHRCLDLIAISVALYIYLLKSLYYKFRFFFRMLSPEIEHNIKICQLRFSRKAQHLKVRTLQYSWKTAFGWQTTHDVAHTITLCVCVYVLYGLRRAIFFGVIRIYKSPIHISPAWFSWLCCRLCERPKRKCEWANFSVSDNKFTLN